MRKIVYGLVLEALGPDWDGKIFSSGSVDGDNLPALPFAVIHFGVVRPGMAQVKDRNIVVWIHDRGADYTAIDAALEAVYGRLDGAEHVPETDGSAELIRAEWTATSGDLFDPGYRTITKNSSYRLIGTGA